MRVYPNIGAIRGSGQLQSIAGALLMIVLIASVLAMIISAVVWALSSSSGNYQTAVRGRAGVLVALGAAVLAGCAVVWLKFLINLGAGL